MRANKRRRNMGVAGPAHLTWIDWRPIVRNGRSHCAEAACGPAL